MDIYYGNKIWDIRTASKAVRFLEFALVEDNYRTNAGTIIKHSSGKEMVDYLIQKCNNKS